MRSFLFLVVLVVLFSGIVSAGQNIECDVRYSCPVESRIIRLSDETNAHVGLLGTGFGDYFLCCDTPDTTDIYITDDEGDDEYSEFVFNLEKDENSHISPITGAFPNDYHLYLDNGFLNCTERNEGCRADEDCLLRFDHEGGGVFPQGHAEDCSFGNFPVSLCCKLHYAVRAEGRILEETAYDTVRPSENAIVEVRYMNNNTPIISVETDADGNFELEDEVDYGIDNLMLYVRKPGYIAQDFGPYDTVVDRLTNIEITLKLADQCMEDCTRMGDDFCDISCDGINNCSFSDATGGILDGSSATAAEICHMQGYGWVKDFNSTHVVECCRGEPYLRPPEHQIYNITTEEDARDIISYDLKTISRRGKMVTLHVSMWS